MAYFRISFRFLDPTFHGRGAGGRPEWPPAPLRAFQSLVAAAAGRADAALIWLADLGHPHIVAPPYRSAGVGYRLYVPKSMS